MWGLGDVVAFRDFRSVALFEHKFLLCENKVRELAVKVPNTVQQFKLKGRVVTEVANELTDMRPVFLFDMGPVVAVPSSRPREGDLLAFAIFE